NRSSNQLVDYQLPAMTGFPGVLSNLDATVENEGIELALQTRNIETENIRWSSIFNITFPKTRLVEFPGLETSPYASQFKIGEPLSIQRGYVWA
ncbi:hypothetical protein KK062_30365, partial [Fulvivirgaceae bacterium PWU5]